jgi:EmrB/QacA subfamily drug resistance transporter
MAADPSPVQDRQELEDNARRRTRIITGVILGSFLAALDTTILATAMPTIVAELGGLSVYSWVFSVYMIMTAVSMPVWGKLADTVGKRSIFFAAVGLFLTASILCGFSRSMVHLVIFRGIQGIGAGGLASVPFALISTVFPVHQRGKALGLLASAWGISSVVGPMIGSFLVLQLDWRWVFFVNLPLGITSLLIVASSYRESSRHRTEKIDYVGSLLLCFAILSLMMLFLWTGRAGTWASPEAGAAGIVFLLCLGLFIRHEGRVEHPVLELRFFRLRAFWLGNLLGFLASFSAYGVIAYMPLFAQISAGGTPVQAGVAITSMSLSWSTASIIAGRLVYRIGEKKLIFAGMLVMSAGFLLIVLGPAGAPLGYLSLCVVVIGLGMGCQTPSLMLTVQHSLDGANLGVATSSQMLARTIGGALGVSVMGSAVAGRMLLRFQELAAAGQLGGLPPEARGHMGEPQELLSAHMRSLMSAADLRVIGDAFSSAVHGAFGIGLVVAVLGTVGAFLLPRSTLHAPGPDRGAESVGKVNTPAPDFQE